MIAETPTILTTILVPKWRKSMDQEQTTSGKANEPPKLMSSDLRDAIYHLLGEIRGSDTIRELKLHMKRGVDFQREIHDFLTRIDAEFVAKLEEFVEDEDAASTDDLSGRREERRRGEG